MARDKRKDRAKSADVWSSSQEVFLVQHLVKTFKSKAFLNRVQKVRQQMGLVRSDSGGYRPRYTLLGTDKPIRALARSHLLGSIPLAALVVLGDRWETQELRLTLEELFGDRSTDSTSSRGSEQPFNLRHLAKLMSDGSPASDKSSVWPRARFWQERHLRHDFATLPPPPLRLKKGLPDISADRTFIEAFSWTTVEDVKKVFESMERRLPAWRFKLDLAKSLNLLNRYCDEPGHTVVSDLVTEYAEFEIDDESALRAHLRRFAGQLGLPPPKRPRKSR